MPDKPVDGFSDVAPQKANEGNTPSDQIGSPDPGATPGAPKPLDPDERAKLEEEIKHGDQEGHHGHVPAGH